MKVKIFAVLCLAAGLALLLVSFTDLRVPLLALGQPALAGGTPQTGLDILLDPGAQVQAQYRVRGFPSSYFIDQNGVVRAVELGTLSESQLDRYLKDVGVGK